MGYRSDVAFGVGFRSRDRLVSFLTALKLTGDFDTDFMTDLKVINDGDDVWLLHGQYEDIKWYDGFPEVVGTRKLLSYAEDMGHPTAFIRVGENTADIQEEYGEQTDVWMWDYYRVARSIDQPASGDGTPVMEMLDSDLRA